MSNANLPCCNFGMPFLDRKVIAAIHLQAHGLLWKGFWRERRPEGPTQLRFYLQNRHVLDQAAKPVFYKILVDRVFHLMRPSNKGPRRTAFRGLPRYGGNL